MNGAPDREPPAEDTEPPPSSAVQTAAAFTGEPRVLIVDDDDDARTQAATALRDVGFVVEEASNGLDGLKLFESHRPQIALLEVMTPFVDGFSTCRAIRDLPGGKDASIIIMTDLDDVESLRFGYEAGATDFITKPVNPIVLQHRIKYMLRAAETVDQLRKSQRKVAHLAYHDALTNLPNRRSLDRYMRRLLEFRSGAEGAVFLIDLDGFKRVNDTFGHTAGDELICEVARRVTRCFGIDASVDTVEIDTTRPLLARLGGDEFVLVSPSVRDDADAVTTSNAMLAAIGTVFDLRGHEIVITASIGIALLGERGNPEVLLQRADAAMYDAKAHDRNNARLYSRHLDDKGPTRLKMEVALRNAIGLGELELHYQPKVDTATSIVTGCEALLRWNSAELGPVSPAEFIPVGEESGLIVPIGRWVLREACRQASAWHAIPEMRGLRVAVNVSARQFRDSRFLDDLEQILTETGLHPHALELEITEGTLMNDTKFARTVLRELKSWGVWLALDDFGTGYSSLGYLRRFPFDTLKVDRSFVRDMLTDEGSAAITGAVIAMAQKLHLTVVAEGVETPEQLACLRSLGCTEVQGFHFSRALPARDFEAWTAGRLSRRELVRPREMAADGRNSAIPALLLQSA